MKITKRNLIKLIKEIKLKEDIITDKQRKIRLEKEIIEIENNLKKDNYPTEYHKREDIRNLKINKEILKSLKNEAITRREPTEQEKYNREFNRANEAMHPVEKEWVYKIMTKYGFKPITKTAKGFVRSYKFVGHGHTIIWSVGASADYWNDNENKAFGYWTDLEPYLKKITH